MDPKELFVGRKVWLKPNPLIRDQYLSDYVETEITYVGTSRFKIKDENKADYVTYRISDMKEHNVTPTKGEVLLSIDGVDDFERREQKMFKIRRYMNSRKAYNTTEENLDQIIALLKL